MSLRLTRRGLAAATLLLPAIAHAQPRWPDRPLRMVVPWAPGGGSDTLARLLATPMSQNLGQPVVVENRAGAGAVIGSEAVMRSAPDGTTLLLGDTPLATVPAVQAAGNRPVPFEAARDFTAICALAEAPGLLTVQGSSRFRSMRDFLDAARANPTAINFASAGTASSTHLMLELLMMRSGVRMTHVPYRGAAPAVQDVLNGTVQATFMALATAAPLVASGQVRVLGVAGESRMAALPDAPTMREQGIDLVAGFWWGLLGPAGIPEPVVARLVESANQAMEHEAVAARLPALGLQRLRMGPAEFKTLLAQETTRWRDVVQTAGIVPE
jgi:tripartite-type tricarboxylate transporter receptor subunit TctC